MKTLLIDNYDSFSHILFQYLWEVNGQEPIFMHNNSWTLSDIQAMSFDSILISPGPGRPDIARDFGICCEVIKAFPHLPILGVCLGHQGLGLAAGAKVVAAPVVRHGKPSLIHHTGQGLFTGLPQDFSAIRYHSLVVEKESCPAALEITATALDDDQIMGINLIDRPGFGLQFHPESIGTEVGKKILFNFSFLSKQYLKGREGSVTLETNVPLEGIGMQSQPFQSRPLRPHPIPGGDILELVWHDPEDVFMAFFANHPAAFWLDSEAQSHSGISYMGVGARVFETMGQATRVLTVDASTGTLTEIESMDGDPLDTLHSTLYGTEAYEFPKSLPKSMTFRGGLVGYFGYGLGQKMSGIYPSESLSGSISEPRSGSLIRSDMPDALFLQPDRILAFDPESRKVFAYLPPVKGQAKKDASNWLSTLPARWAGISKSNLQIHRNATQANLSSSSSTTTTNSSTLSKLRLDWKLSADKKNYLEQIRNVQVSIRQGESYEACLTNEVSVASDADPLLVYRLLRRTNPAPYSAYLRFPHGRILSTSPERFLKLNRQGHLSSRPIKGTRPRGRNAEEDAKMISDLSHHEKDRSENLMIVDLVRNDFGKVCELGSISVPELMVVESHPTVFQLVSEVTGKLAPGRTAMDAMRACFPGGSMTGAPKLRTMELLLNQEKRERGVFSGALGYLGSDGSMDMGMVIRTLVYREGLYKAGCGGAILAESDPEGEFAEALLKAFAPQRALELAVLGESGEWSFRNMEMPLPHD